MPAYESNFFSLPAPVARVTLRNAESGATLADVPLLTNQAVGFLGRDVLNHLSVLLDGPRLNWEAQ